MDGEAIANPESSGVKIPKNCKENRYYYKHREEVLERKRKKRMEDPEYIAKMKEREEKKIEKEELKKAKELAKEERRKTMEALNMQKEAEREAKRKIVESLFLKTPGAKIAVE
jgi:hypothetical protein